MVCGGSGSSSSISIIIVPFSIFVVIYEASFVIPIFVISIFEVPAISFAVKDIVTNIPGSETLPSLKITL